MKNKNNPKGAGRKPRYGVNMKKEAFWLLPGEKEIITKVLVKIRTDKYGY